MEMFFSLLFLGVNVGNIFFKSRIISLVSISSLLLLAAYSYGISDYGMYEYYYQNSTKYNFDLDSEAAKWYMYSSDLGYTFTNTLSNYLGFEFLTYHVIYIIISFFCIYGVAAYWCGQKAFPVFVLLYYIYPFLLDVIQMRNTIIITFLLVGITALSSKSRFSYSIYLGSVIIGSFFHKVAVLFVPFVFFYSMYKKTNWMKKICILLVFVGIMLPVYGEWIKSNLDFINAYLMLQDEDAYNNMEWYLNHQTNLKYLAVWGEAASMSVILYYIKNKIDKNLYSEREINFINLIFILSLYIIVLSPFFPIYDDFSRLPRDIVCLFYIVLAMTLDRARIKDKIKLCIMVIGWIFVFSYVFFFSLLSNEITSFFQYNYLLNLGY